MKIASIAQYNVSTGKLVQVLSRREYVKDQGMDPQTVGQILRSVRSSHAGYTFRRLSQKEVKAVTAVTGERDFGVIKAATLQKKGISIK